MYITRCRYLGLFLFNGYDPKVVVEVRILFVNLQRLLEQEFKFFLK
jgi:hypothetical protein